MAVAEVTRITTDPSRLEQDREYTHKLCDEIAARDGCETLIVLIDGADSLAVVIWRDRDAYDVYAKDRDRIVEESARETKSTVDAVSAPRIYEVEYRK